MFDSPMDWCSVCGEWVLLDQTQGECAAEHHCGLRACPLASAFSVRDGEAAAISGPAPRNVVCREKPTR